MSSEDIEEYTPHHALGTVLDSVINVDDFTSIFNARLTSLSTVAEALKLSNEVHALSDQITEKFGPIISDGLHTKMSSTLRAFQNN